MRPSATQRKRWVLLSLCCLFLAWSASYSDFMIFQYPILKHVYFIVRVFLKHLIVTEDCTVFSFHANLCSFFYQCFSAATNFEILYARVKLDHPALLFHITRKLCYCSFYIPSVNIAGDTTHILSFHRHTDCRSVSLQRNCLRPCSRV